MKAFIPGRSSVPKIRLVLALILLSSIIIVYPYPQTDGLSTAVTGERQGTGALSQSVAINFSTTPASPIKDASVTVGLTNADSSTHGPGQITSTVGLLVPTLLSQFQFDSVVQHTTPSAATEPQTINATPTSPTGAPISSTTRSSGADFEDTRGDSADAELPDHEYSNYNKDVGLSGEKNTASNPWDAVERLQPHQTLALHNQTPLVQDHTSLAPIIPTSSFNMNMDTSSHQSVISSNVSSVYDVSSTQLPISTSNLPNNLPNNSSHVGSSFENHWATSTAVNISQASPQPTTLVGTPDVTAAGYSSGPVTQQQSQVAGSGAPLPLN